MNEKDVSLQPSPPPTLHHPPHPLHIIQSVRKFTVRWRVWWWKDVMQLPVSISIAAVVPDLKKWWKNTGAFTYIFFLPFSSRWFSSARLPSAFIISPLPILSNSLLYCFLYSCVSSCSNEFPPPKHCGSLLTLDLPPSWSVCSCWTCSPYFFLTWLNVVYLSYCVVGVLSTLASFFMVLLLCCQCNCPLSIDATYNMVYQNPLPVVNTRHNIYLQIFW